MMEMLETDQFDFNKQFCFFFWANWNCRPIISEKIDTQELVTNFSKEKVGVYP